MKKAVILFKKVFNSRKRAIAGIIILLVIGGVFFRIFISNKNQQPQYQTTNVERGTVVSSVSVSGQIISVNIVSITTQASGVVQKVFVKDGDTVNVGQKIMEVVLDTAGQQRNASAWSSYLSAKNSLESTKITQYTLQSDLFSKWDEFKNLAESSTYQNPDGSPNYVNRALPEFHIAENDWLAAESKYKNQQSVITQSQASFNNAWLSYQQSSPVVAAPMAGTIFSLSVAEGMSLGGQDSSTSDTSQSQRIAVIQNQANPLASFSLSEIDVSQVKDGQKATITLDSFPDKTFTGKVVSIDRVGTVTSGVTNYPIIIQFDTNLPQILPNMTATAEVITEAKENVLWVPPQAVRKQAGQTVVRVLVSGKPQEKQVEVGLETSSQAEIISGLSEGETVIVSEVTASEESTFGGGGFRGIMPGGGFSGRPR